MVAMKVNPLSQLLDDPFDIRDILADLLLAKMQAALTDIGRHRIYRMSEILTAKSETLAYSYLLRP